MGSDLDATDRALLDALQSDGRLSVAELARRIHLGATATADRIRRLEGAGVITGYHARVDLSRVGLPVQAIVRLEYRGHRHEPMHALLAHRGEIVEAFRVTGEDCYVLTIAARDTTALEDVVDELSALGTTTTSVVYAHTLPHRGAPLSSDSDA